MSHKDEHKGYSVNKYLYSFCINPHITFETQETKETVILLVRAHPFTFVSKVATLILFVLAPLFVNIFLGNFLLIKQIIIVNILWYGLVFLYAYINLLLWVFDVGIVTNLRVIDVDYHSLFSKEISMSSLSEITDVTGKSNGFIQSALHFGDVYVQTAGLTQNIEFIGAPEPSVVVSMINKLIRKT